MVKKSRWRRRRGGERNKNIYWYKRSEGCCKREEEEEEDKRTPDFHVKNQGTMGTRLIGKERLGQ